MAENACSSCSLPFSPYVTRPILPTYISRTSFLAETSLAREKEISHEISYEIFYENCGSPLPSELDLRLNWIDGHTIGAYCGAYCRSSSPTIAKPPTPSANPHAKTIGRGSLVCFSRAGGRPLRAPVPRPGATAPLVIARPSSSGFSATYSRFSEVSEKGGKKEKGAQQTKQLLLARKPQHSSGPSALTVTHCSPFGIGFVRVPMHSSL